MIDAQVASIIWQATLVFERLNNVRSGEGALRRLR